MILASQITALLSRYTLTDVLLIGAGLFLIIKEIKKYISEHKKEKKDELEHYHEERTAIETHDESVENRIATLEKHQAEDYIRIQKSESHLYQMEQDFKEIKDIVLESRIEELRNNILNAPSKCLDLTRPVSVDLYNSIFSKYTEYEEILETLGRKNGQADFSMELIADSYEKRLAAGMFSEQLYLDPEEAKKKIRAMTEKGGYYSTWWEKNQKKEEKEK